MTAAYSFSHSFMSVAHQQQEWKQWELKQIASFYYQWMYLKIIRLVIDDINWSDFLTYEEINLRALNKFASLSSIALIAN